MTWMTWFQGANVFPLVLRRWECTWNVCCVRQHAPPLNHIILLCLLFVWSFGVCLGCWMYIHWIHVFIYISIFIQFIYICSFIFKGMLTPSTTLKPSKSATLRRTFKRGFLCFGAPFLSEKNTPFLTWCSFPKDARCWLMKYTRSLRKRVCLWKNGG